MGKALQADCAGGQENRAVTADKRDEKCQLRICAQLCGTGTSLLWASVSIVKFGFLDLKGPKSQAMLSLMKSALGLILGVSILAMAVVVGGCDNGGADDDGKPVPTIGGSANNAGSGTVIPGAGTSTGGTSGDVGEGVPLDPMNGWVDGASNALMIQGAMFPFGDPTSLMGSAPMDFSMSGAEACFSGTAAKVDMASTACKTMTFTPPAKDCYGEYWGAAIGLNLNQQIDMTTMKGGDPMPFNASSLKGFAFEIAGTMVPAQTALRFKVEDASGEFCNPATKPVKAGPNSFMFEDLIKECWKPTATAANASTAKAGVIKIAWQVVTNDKSTVPFNFCVSKVRALQ
jgi:hypothetical protein